MTNQHQDCDYISHDNGIHEFINHAATRQAVDILLEKVFEIVSALAANEPLLVLNDLTESGIPPLRYAMSRSKELVKHYYDGTPTQQNPVLMAYVVQSNSMVSTFKFLIEQLGRGTTTIKIFNDRESAMAWLVSQQVEKSRSV
ncbi:MAG: hypothetical protein RLP44_21005 [Aggregatilineales bacterium]